MKKHTSEEAFYERIRNLANVNKTSVKESQNRTLGTLIDFKRAADGVAYGIIKEQHNYYIKKGGLKENLTVADFAYIGGLANITEFQYNKLSEAEKQRNMLFRTINEAVSSKPSKTGSKKRLNEDVAGQEIDNAESKLDDLDAATSAAEVPAEPAMSDDGSAEMAAGLDAMGGEEVPAEPAMGGEEGDAMPTDSEMGGEEGDAMPTDDDAMGGEEGGDGEDVAVEDPQSESEREIEKNLGKLTNTLRKTELTDSQVKSYVNTFLSAFKDKFPDVDIEDRKTMAEKITKVVPPEDIEDLGQNVEDTEGAPKPEEEMAEQKCSECGGFAQYAESRGYGSAEALMECGEEEVGNLVSGYANAHSEGQNDGDLDTVALVIKVINPELLNTLKNDYGHEEYSDKLSPIVTGMNESSEEDNIAQLNELFGGLNNLRKAAGAAIGGAAKSAYNAVGGAAKSAYNAVGDATTQIKQTYNAGEINPEVKKLEAVAANLGKQIDALNKRMVGAGKQPVNVKSILATIQNQVGAGGQANLSKFRTNEVEVPVDSTEVQPMMEDKLKAGKKLSSTNVPVKPITEEEEEEVDINNLDVDSEKDSEIKFAPAAQSLGGGVVKPSGAETTTVEVTKGGVNVTMSESEQKLRKYIRNRLEENAGIRKPVLTETKKSETLKKLDSTIDKQFKLFESQAMNEILGFSVKEKFAKLDPNNENEVNKLFKQAFNDIMINPRAQAIAIAAGTTPVETKYDILRQYIANGGGTLRLLDRSTVKYEPQQTKDAATRSQFAGGGTQGKTSFGGTIGK